MLRKSDQLKRAIGTFQPCRERPIPPPPTGWAKAECRAWNELERDLMEAYASADEVRKVYESAGGQPAFERAVLAELAWKNADYHDGGEKYRAMNEALAPFGLHLEAPEDLR